ncbi:hypothetical protein JCM9957A_49760 [Kineosporia succinea]
MSATYRNRRADRAEVRRGRDQRLVAVSVELSTFVANMIPIVSDDRLTLGSLLWKQAHQERQHLLERNVRVYANVRTLRFELLRFGPDRGVPLVDEALTLMEKSQHAVTRDPIGRVPDKAANAVREWLVRLRGIADDLATLAPN